MKILPIILIIPFFIFSCQKPYNEASFTGTWVEKNLLSSKDNDSSELAGKSAPFRLIYIDGERADSVLYYYNDSKRIVYPAHYAYDSYYTHFDKNNEYYLLYDYPTRELIFSNLANDRFFRFVKVDTTLKKDNILSPYFNLDSLIRTAK